jgi:hypothetical protein
MDCCPVQRHNQVCHLKRSNAHWRPIDLQR